MRKSKLWVFRGQSDARWTLTPKISRPEYKGAAERLAFEAWKRRAIAYVRSPIDSDWGWLAVAQHHGLATRLLDWSTNPLVACYFAVQASEATDGAVFAAKFTTTITEPHNIHPLEFSGVARFFPRAFASRIVQQGGIFSIQDNPDKPLEERKNGVEGMQKIVISKDYRKELLGELAYYGINSATLFPDLDGLSRFVNWSLSSKEWWSISEVETPQA